MEIAALRNDDLADAVIKENFARENVVTFTSLQVVAILFWETQCKKSSYFNKKVNMTRKRHIHRLQINPRHRKEETDNTGRTIEEQIP